MPEPTSAAVLAASMHAEANRLHQQYRAGYVRAQELLRAGAEALLGGLWPSDTAAVLAAWERRRPLASTLARGCTCLDCSAIATLDAHFAALHGQPFGFTWEMVDALRMSVVGYRSGDFNGFNSWNDEQAALLEAAADCIAALLPPREAAS